jgi:hypothetical protein
MRKESRIQKARSIEGDLLVAERFDILDSEL